MVALGNILFYGLGTLLLLALGYAAVASYQAHRNDEEN